MKSVAALAVTALILGYFSWVSAAGMMDTRVLYGSTTYDFVATTGTTSTPGFSVPGAAVGDPVSVGVPVGAVIDSAVYQGYVQSADTVIVSLTYTRATGSADPPSSVFKVAVFKQQ